jgi:hypothetical protein
MIKKVFYLILFFCFACKNNCPDFIEISQSIFKEEQEIFASKKEKVDKLEVAFRKIITDSILSNETSKENIQISIEFQDSSSAITKSHQVNGVESCLRLLKDLNFKKATIKGFNLKQDPLIFVYLYPKGMDKYGQRNCSNVSAEVIYFYTSYKNESSSPNFKLFELRDNWYIRSEISSL